MTNIIKGKLEPFFETGTEGTIWSVYEDGKEGHNGLHCLEYGDFLRIFDSEETTKVVWEGRIDYDWKINFRPYPMNPEYGQQEVLGFWVHGIQKDVNPEVWGTWFFKQYPAEMERANIGHFYPMKSSSITAYCWKGTGGLYNKGTAGDLILKFNNGGYYKYKDVPPDVFWEFYRADSHGKYFYTNIKNKFVTEKIDLKNNNENI